jgi:hypothetical protein
VTRKVSWVVIQVQVVFICFGTDFDRFRSDGIIPEVNVSPPNSREHKKGHILNKQGQPLNLHDLNLPWVVPALDYFERAKNKQKLETKHVITTDLLEQESKTSEQDHQQHEDLAGRQHLDAFNAQPFTVADLDHHLVRAYTADYKEAENYAD